MGLLVYFFGLFSFKFLKFHFSGFFLATNRPEGFQKLREACRKIVCASQIPPRHLAASTRRLGGSEAWRLGSLEVLICYLGKFLDLFDGFLRTSNI